MLAHLRTVPSVSRHSLFKGDEMFRRTLAPPSTVSCRGQGLGMGVCVLMGVLVGTLQREAREGSTSLPAAWPLTLSLN